jgi:hypothetical protein
VRIEKIKKKMQRKQIQNELKMYQSSSKKERLKTEPREGVAIQFKLSNINFEDDLDEDYQPQSEQKKPERSDSDTYSVKQSPAPKSGKEEDEEDDEEEEESEEESASESSYSSEESKIYAVKKDESNYDFDENEDLLSESSEEEEDSGSYDTFDDEAFLGYLKQD